MVVKVIKIASVDNNQRQFEASISVKLVLFLQLNSKFTNSDYDIIKLKRNSVGVKRWTNRK